MQNPVWLVGSGSMAAEYIKVLTAQNRLFVVIGRGDESAGRCEEQTGCSVIRGGIDAFLESRPSPCSHAIVAVNDDALAETTMKLLRHGVKKILVEKPAGLSGVELAKVAELATCEEADVFVGYNRRFFSSVLKAKEIVEDEGGVNAFCFEFTERSDQIAGLSQNKAVKEKWFLANSTHVVDLAFYLGGIPRDIKCFTSGGLGWHPAASIFAGAGIADNGALFSYHANWESAGRWAVEIMTRKSRLIFRPMEKLQIQEKGQFEITEVAIGNDLDLQFKPGIFRQLEAFLAGEFRELCTIASQAQKMELFQRMAGYQSGQ